MLGRMVREVVRGARRWVEQLATRTRGVLGEARRGVVQLLTRGLLFLLETVLQGRVPLTQSAGGCDTGI